VEQLRQSLKESTPKIMGILNITSDSFFDGGKYASTQSAIDQGVKLAGEGADILDIGAESSRPFAVAVSQEKELCCVVPVISALRKKVTIPLSIDTYKPHVAREAIKQGASMVNDITGATNPLMRALIQETKSSICVMHMQGTPQTMQQNPLYEKGVLHALMQFFENQCSLLVKEGVSEKSIYIDPGIGFGKTVQDNLVILKSLKKLSTLGFPLILGISRKSFMGKILDKKACDLLNATVIINTIVSQEVPLILRVHDVKEHKELFLLMEALKN
jgi:dihydropteroate synthase